MVKSALMVAALTAATTVMAASQSHADAKLIYAANSNPVKDAVQVLRGDARAYVPAWQEVEVPTVSPYSVVGAGDGWLLDRRNGRIVSCYKVGTGYVGRRAIRCVSADINAVTY